MTHHVVLMGVAGTGKSAVGKPVAGRLGADFAEGDDFHPRANLEKMSSGTPLTDEDGMTVDISRPVQEIVEDVMARLDQRR